MNYPAGYGYQQPYYPYGAPQGQQMRPQQQVLHVSGKEGLKALKLAPDSSALVLDDTAPLVWLCQTDSAGYMTQAAYSIAPYVEPEPVDLDALNARLERLEVLLSGNGKPDPVGHETKRKTAAEQRAE